MARLTLGDQVSIVSTGEKGTIVGESNGLYDVRIGGAGTMETRRGVRRRDLERFVPEFSSPFNGMVQVNIPGVTGVPMSAAQQGLPRRRLYARQPSALRVGLQAP